MSMCVKCGGFACVLQLQTEVQEATERMMYDNVPHKLDGTLIASKSGLQFLHN